MMGKDSVVSPRNNDFVSSRIPKNNLIGITGGIGAGKSVVSRVLRILGFPVYDCDMEAKRLMDTDSVLKEEIASQLGRQCVNADGALCRGAIADIIFSDGEARNWLNSRVHTAVFREVESFAEVNAGKRVFVESAILRTSGLWQLCSQVWIVTAPEEERIKRVETRSSLSPEKIRERIESQQNEFRYASLLPEESIIEIPNSYASPLLEILMSKISSLPGLSPKYHR